MEIRFALNVLCKTIIISFGDVSNGDVNVVVIRLVSHQVQFSHFINYHLKFILLLSPYILMLLKDYLPY